MKKILTITLSILLVITAFIPVYGALDSPENEEDEQQIENIPEVLELSLEDAIEYALVHNKDVNIAELNIKKAQVAYDQSKRQIKKSKDMQEEYENMISPSDMPKDDMSEEQYLGYVEAYNSMRSVFTNPDTIVQQKLFDNGATERSIDLSLQMPTYNKDLTINQVKYNVEKAYYDLKLAEEQANIVKESFELANKQYEQSKKMHELGTISTQQLLSIELGVSQAQSGLDAATMGYELQKMSFNNTLGLPLDQEIVLTSDIEYKEHEAIDLEKSIKLALENNAGLKISQESYEISKLTLEAIKVRYPEITYKYREQEVAVEQALKNLESAKNGVEMGVRAAYLSLTTAEKQINTYKKAVQKAQKALELAELSFELGQGTSNEVTQARIELMNAKKSLAEQVHSYNMALLDFNYSTGLGKNPVPGM